MNELLLKVLTFAYASIGIISNIAYWPTIRDLYVYKKPSANLTSYLLWTATSGIAFLYGLFILKDPLFRIVSGLSFSANFLIAILSTNLKRKLSTKK